MGTNIFTYDLDVTLKTYLTLPKNFPNTIGIVLEVTKVGDWSIILAIQTAWGVNILAILILWSILFFLNFHLYFGYISHT